MVLMSLTAGFLNEKEFHETQKGERMMNHEDGFFLPLKFFSAGWRS